MKKRPGEEEVEEEEPANCKLADRHIDRGKTVASLHGMDVCFGRSLRVLDCVGVL